jgi:hypothetical protein
MIPYSLLLLVVILACLVAQNLAQFIGFISCVIGAYRLLFRFEETKSLAWSFKRQIDAVKYTDRQLTIFAYSVGTVVATIAFAAFMAVWLQGRITGNWMFYLLALPAELAVGFALMALVLAPIPLAKRIARL